jgi:hypothetical protein
VLLRSISISPHLLPLRHISLTNSSISHLFINAEWRALEQHTFLVRSALGSELPDALAAHLRVVVEAAEAVLRRTCRRFGTGDVDDGRGGRGSSSEGGQSREDDGGVLHLGIWVVGRLV